MYNKQLSLTHTLSLFHMSTHEVIERMYSGTYINRNNETYWDIQRKKKKLGKVVEMKKVSSVTMNVLTKTSTLFKSMYTNYQENWSLYNTNNKKVFSVLLKFFINLALFIEVKPKFWLLDWCLLLHKQAHTRTHTYSTTWIISTNEIDKIPNIVQKHPFFSGLKVKIKKQK